MEKLNTLKKLELSVLKVLNYFDIFKHPVTIEEIWQFADHQTSIEELKPIIERLIIEGKIKHQKQFYYLGDDSIIGRREKGNKLANDYSKKIHHISKRIARFPFVRAILISGSLSKNYMDEYSDIDLFIIAKKGRLWLCKTFLALFFLRIHKLVNKKEAVCLNYFIDTEALTIPENNVYIATEIATLIPTYNYALYQAFLDSNQWIKNYIPNTTPHSNERVVEKRFFFKKIQEWIFDTIIGDVLEYLFYTGSTYYWRWSKKYKKSADHSIEHQKDPFIYYDKHVVKPHPKGSFHLRVINLYNKKIANLMSPLNNTHKSTILFTHSYFLKFDPKQWKAKQPYPPLATILAAAVMRENGFNVALHDTNFANSAEEIIPILKKEKPEYVVIYDDGFNYLTKMCLTNMREAAFKMAEYAKMHGCKVIVSSSDAADHYEKYLKHHADFVIIGEGEIALKELIFALENKHTNFDSIQGLAFKTNEKITLTSKRTVIKNLDEFPLPAWDLVDMDIYKKTWLKHHGYFSLNIATTRGCPYKCNWCAKPIYGNRYNSRSPEHVIKEIEYVIKNYQPTYFWMCDDIFGLKPGWAQEFNQLVKEKKLNFKYKIQSRVDLLLESDNLEVLASSGLETAWVGAESGSQAILDAMDKGTKVEEIYKATKLLKEKGIHVAFFLQFGYLGETKEDIDLTIKMVKDLLPDDMGVSVSYPLPGTKFYEKVKEDLKTKTNWTDSDDLDLMFKNTYPPAFYKKLHRYIHKIHRRKLGYQNIKKIFRTPLRLTIKELRYIIAIPYYILTSLAYRIQLKKLMLTSG